jgi:hypothetical protein
MTKFTTRRLDPSDYKGADIAGIIGAPLVAATQANSMMAREQVKFLMDFCFSKKDEGYEPIMVRMSITRAMIEPASTGASEPKIIRVVSTFEVPLLTIVPINSLALESIDVDFDLEVTSHVVSDSEGSRKDDEKREPVKLYGKVGKRRQDGSHDSGNHYDQKSSSSLKVHIKSGLLPLPVGITSILNLYTKNLQPIEIGKEKPDTP